MLIKNIIQIVTINHDTNINQQPHLHQQEQINIPMYYQFQTRNYALPSNSTGFIYILLTPKNHNWTYISQTRNIVQQLIQHNSGHGLRGTSENNYRPIKLLRLFLVSGCCTSIEGSLFIPSLFWPFLSGGSTGFITAQGIGSRKTLA